MLITVRNMVSVRSICVKAICLVLLSMQNGFAQVHPDESLLDLDFAQGTENLAPTGGEVHLQHGLRWSEDDHALKFTTARQTAELDRRGMQNLSAALRDVEALTIGGWFRLRRQGEQVLLGRGDVRIGPLGERFFRPSEEFVNFCLGTDRRGFLMGTINGNGTMPFVHVTVNRVPVQVWQQLVVVKDAKGRTIGLLSKNPDVDRQSTSVLRRYRSSS